MLTEYNQTQTERWETEMYQIVGAKRVMSFFGLTCGAVVIIWAVMFPPDNVSDFGQWWKIVSAVVGDVMLLLVLVGQSELFPMFCRLPFIRNVFPDIDGEWRAELVSNWEEILRRSGTSTARPKGEPFRGRVVIVARLFDIKVRFSSDDNYSRSSSVFVQAERDEIIGRVRINYFYRNNTLEPLETDCAIHNGAASLEIYEEGAGSMWMEGTYWTDRNWHRALNTAGKITMRRA
jgi:hypothetical protein